MEKSIGSGMPTPPASPPTAEQSDKAEKAIETEPLTDARPDVVRRLTTPPLSRSETGESVEIVGDVLVS